MRVTVRRHDSAWEGLPGGGPGDWRGGRAEVEAAAGTTVGGLLRLIDVDPNLVALVTVNGRAAEQDRELADGDRIDLVPPITGG
jgi:sulfur carrier protein ThiS